MTLSHPDTDTSRQLVLWVEKFEDPDKPGRFWWHWVIYRGEDVHTYLDESSEWFDLKRDALADGRLALEAWQIAEGELLDALYSYMDEARIDAATMLDLLKAMVEDVRGRRAVGL